MCAGSIFDWFTLTRSPFQVQVDRTADWWLGELDDEYFRALEGAVRDEWQVEPLRIREGGVSATCDVILVKHSDNYTVYSVCSVSGKGIGMSCIAPSNGPKLCESALFWENVQKLDVSSPIGSSTLAK